eukprot:CAMPEP_0194365698 /NCGR_PEP_ID=MMETSP0174-20130528/13746_1 /TAXON_ID=216777 /ORGANISM="Proboscia alata, Strain PI-D3" /LENGTH=655 /DNA_ID=CAMNT_0039140521 /DNA_START=609 /DNA_END=2576 /DNA_ORIENTATION=-
MSTNSRQLKKEWYTPSPTTSIFPTMIPSTVPTVDPPTTVSPTSYPVPAVSSLPSVVPSLKSSVLPSTERTNSPNSVEVDLISETRDGNDETDDYEYVEPDNKGNLSAVKLSPFKMTLAVYTKDPSIKVNFGTELLIQTTFHLNQYFKNAMSQQTQRKGEFEASNDGHAASYDYLSLTLESFVVTGLEWIDNNPAITERNQNRRLLRSQHVINRADDQMDSDIGVRRLNQKMMIRNEVEAMFGGVSYYLSKDDREVAAEEALPSDNYIWSLQSRAFSNDQNDEFVSMLTKTNDDEVLFTADTVGVILVDENGLDREFEYTSQYNENQERNSQYSDAPLNAEIVDDDVDKRPWGTSTNVIYIASIASGVAVGVLIVTILFLYKKNVQHRENFYLAQDVDVKNIPTLKESPSHGKKKPRKQLPQQQPPMESSAQNSSMPTSTNTTPTKIEFPVSTSGHLQINSKDDHKRRMKQILGSEADSEMLDAYSGSDGMVGSGHDPQSSAAKPVHDAPQAVTSTSFGISGVHHSLDFAAIDAHGTTNPVPPPSSIHDSIQDESTLHTYDYPSDVYEDSTVNTAQYENFLYPNGMNEDNDDQNSLQSYGYSLDGYQSTLGGSVLGGASVSADQKGGAPGPLQRAANALNRTSYATSQTLTNNDEE